MMRILVADDERIIRKGIIAIINSAQRDWEVIGEASDGIDVLHLLEQEIPDALITDIRMAQMNGIDLAKLIRKQNPELCIIVISGYANFNFAKEAIGFNAVDYLLKPIDPEDLIKALKKAECILKKREAAERQGNGALFSEQNSRYRKIIQEAVRYITMHYQSNLTMTKVARKVNVSPNYFCELFKQETGVNFSEYLTRLRIQKAKNLLQSGDHLKIYEVSQLVGYNDERYFCKIFKKIEGTTPAFFKEEKQ
jgi:two-component system response regulator YesN